MKYSSLDGNKFIQHLRNDAGIGVFVYDQDHQILEWCETMHSYTGLSREECLNKTITEILELNNYKDLASVFNNALQGDFCIISTLRFDQSATAGKDVNYDLHLFPMEEVDQQVNAVLVMVIPTPSNSTKKKHSLIRTTLTNINGFLKNAPIPIFIVDAELNLKLANKAFYTFTGRAPEHTKNLRSFVPPAILEHLQKHILTVIRTGHPHSVSEYYQLQSGPRLLNNILFPVHNHLGEVDSIGGYLIDMTRQAKQQRENEALLEETLRLNKALNQQNSELQQKKAELDQANKTLSEQKVELERVVQELSDRNYELDQIMYKTSHDLRAPLTSILGLLQLAKQEKDTSKLPEYHQFMENRVNKLDDFVKTMLTFAKSSRTDLTLEPIDWQQLVQGSLEQVQYLEHFSKIHIQLSINSEIYSFLSDPMRLNIILNNLIGNAIKYADTRKPEAFVKVRINNTPKGASIEVEDNGIGIPQVYIDKVCDMFFRATDRSEGSGLGLYIVKQTVDRLNGQLTIESREREGTTISVFLPHASKQPSLKRIRPNTKNNKKKI